MLHIRHDARLGRTIAQMLQSTAFLHGVQTLMASPCSASALGMSFSLASLARLMTSSSSRSRQKRCSHGAGRAQNKTPKMHAHLVLDINQLLHPFFPHVEFMKCVIVSRASGAMQRARWHVDDKPLVLTRLRRCGDTSKWQLNASGGHHGVMFAWKFVVAAVIKVFRVDK